MIGEVTFQELLKRLLKLSVEPSGALGLVELKGGVANQLHTEHRVTSCALHCALSALSALSARVVFLCLFVYDLFVLFLFFVCFVLRLRKLQPLWVTLWAPMLLVGAEAAVSLAHGRQAHLRAQKAATEPFPTVQTCRWA